MMTEPSKSILTREQIRQALAVLREEQQMHPISSAQRKHLFWYGISVVVFISVFFLWILLCIILAPPPTPATIAPAPAPATDTGWDWFDWSLVFFGPPFFGSFLSMAVLFFWNMKLIWQTWREFRIAFRTRLWQLVARQRTRRRWPRRLMIVFGAVLLAPFLVALYANPILGVPLLAFHFLRFARKRLDMLGNADQLAAFLTGLDDSGSAAGIDQVAIPTEVFKEMGDIEDVHIQRRRGVAMAEFRDSGRGYAVLKSRAMTADIAKLDEATRLWVEARIAELASEFPPPDALCDSGGVWRVPVTKTPYEIVCRQDEAARRIELLSLKQGDGRSSTRRTAEAPRD